MINLATTEPLMRSTTVIDVDWMGCHTVALPSGMAATTGVSAPIGGVLGSIVGMAVLGTVIPTWLLRPVGRA
jgi:hypothetical protein